MMKDRAIELLAAVQALLSRAAADRRGQGTLEYAAIVVVAVTIAVGIGVIMTKVGNAAGADLTSKAAEVFTMS